MFGLFDDWFKSFPLAEIKKGQHLDQAKAVDYTSFFNKKTFDKNCPWVILTLVEGLVYWGKINQTEVAEKSFYQTSLHDIEQHFVALDAAKDYPLLAILKRYIEQNLQNIDGAKIELLTAEYDTFQLQEDDFYLKFTIQTQVNQTAVWATPAPSIEAAILFQIIVDSSDFSPIEVRMLS